MEQTTEGLLRRRRRRRRLKKHYRILLAVLVCLTLVVLFRRILPRKTEKEPEAVEAFAAVEELTVEESVVEEKTAFGLKAGPDTLRLDEEVQSEFALIADAETGEIIAEKHAGEKMYPASMTKVLTLLVASEHMSETSGTFTMTREIADYCFSNECSVVGYVVGETVPIEELFYGCILCSGADASLALAQLSAGSHEVFVEWMNAKAEKLELSDVAHFTNCVGVFDETHCCTVEDMALILRAALEDPHCRTVLSTPIFMSVPTEQHPDGQALSNWFVRRIQRQDTGAASPLCGKTGYVPQSGNCAVSYAEDASGHGYLCVTGKSASSWQTVYDHALLYRDYIKNN